MLKTRNPQMGSTREKACQYHLINDLSHLKKVRMQSGHLGWDVALKGPSQPPPFSMPSKLLILHGATKSYCFTLSYVPESVFDYL